MELLQEFVDEWMQHVCRVRESLLADEKGSTKNETRNVSKLSAEEDISIDEKENRAEDSECGGEARGMFGRENLAASCIPVIKSKAHGGPDVCGKKKRKSAEERWNIENLQARSIGEDASRFGYNDGVESEMNKDGREYGSSKLRKPSASGYVAELKGMSANCAESNKRAAENNRGEVRHEVAKEKEVSDGGENVKLNAALQLMKKRYMNKVNESICIAKGDEFKEEQAMCAGIAVPNALSKYEVVEREDGKKRDVKGLSGSNLYKKVIDSQLLKSVPGKEKYGDRKSKTYIPKVGDDDVIADLNFVVPEFAKDPAINFKVKMQDHGVLERYFSNGHEVDIEVLFPHVKNVSNDSPNKWPSQRSGR